MKVDWHQLELRHRDLRIHDVEQRRRLIGSVAEIGQQVPVVVVRDADRQVLIDGHLRVEALRPVHRDTAIATTWPVRTAGGGPCGAALTIVATDVAIWCTSSTASLGPMHKLGAWPWR